MFDKLKYALGLLDNTEIFILLAALVVYHAVILILLSRSLKASLSMRIRALEAERDEHKKNWENRDQSWKDREDELRRIHSTEKEREILQLKAEYDSYISLLEQKLTRSKTRQSEVP
jgi:hypothetical protein